MLLSLTSGITGVGFEGIGLLVVVDDWAIVEDVIALTATLGVLWVTFGTTDDSPGIRLSALVVDVDEL